MTLRAFGLEIEAVVFDVDGVLLDTAAGWTRTEEAFCAAYSVEYTPEIAAGTHGPVTALLRARQERTATADP